MSGRRGSLGLPVPERHIPARTRVRFTWGIRNHEQAARAAAAAHNARPPLRYPDGETISELGHVYNR